MAKNKYAVALGKRGGKAKSEKKTLACRENGKKGGRPKKLIGYDMSGAPQQRSVSIVVIDDIIQPTL